MRYTYTTTQQSPRLQSSPTPMHHHHHHQQQQHHHHRGNNDRNPQRPYSSPTSFCNDSSAWRSSSRSVLQELGPGDHCYVQRHQHQHHNNHGSPNAQSKQALLADSPTVAPPTPTYLACSSASRRESSTSTDNHNNFFSKKVKKSSRGGGLFNSRKTNKYNDLDGQQPASPTCMGPDPIFETKLINDNSNNSQSSLLVEGPAATKNKDNNNKVAPPSNSKQPKKRRFVNTIKKLAKRVVNGGSGKNSSSKSNNNNNNKSLSGHHHATTLTPLACAATKKVSGSATETSTPFDEPPIHVLTPPTAPLTAEQQQQQPKNDNVVMELGGRASGSTTPEVGGLNHHHHHHRHHPAPPYTIEQHPPLYQQYKDFDDVADADSDANHSMSTHHNDSSPIRKNLFAVEVTDPPSFYNQRFGYTSDMSEDNEEDDDNDNDDNTSRHEEEEDYTMSIVGLAKEFQSSSTSSSTGKDSHHNDDINKNNNDNNHNKNVRSNIIKSSPYLQKEEASTTTERPQLLSSLGMESSSQEHPVQRPQSVHRQLAQEFHMATTSIINNAKDDDDDNGENMDYNTARRRNDPTTTITRASPEILVSTEANVQREYHIEDHIAANNNNGKRISSSIPREEDSYDNVLDDLLEQSHGEDEEEDEDEDQVVPSLKFMDDTLDDEQTCSTQQGPLTEEAANNDESNGESCQAGNGTPIANKGGRNHGSPKQPQSRESAGGGDQDDCHGSLDRLKESSPDQDEADLEEPFDVRQGMLLHTSNIDAAASGILESFEGNDEALEFALEQHERELERQELELRREIEAIKKEEEESRLLSEKDCAGDGGSSFPTINDVSTNPWELYQESSIVSMEDDLESIDSLLDNDDDSKNQEVSLESNQQVPDTLTEIKEVSLESNQQVQDTFSEITDSRVEISNSKEALTSSAENTELEDCHYQPTAEEQNSCNDKEELGVDTAVEECEFERIEEDIGTVDREEFHVDLTDDHNEDIPESDDNKDDERYCIGNTETNASSDARKFEATGNLGLNDDTPTADSRDELDSINDTIQRHELGRAVSGAESVQEDQSAVFEEVWNDNPDNTPNSITEICEDIDMPPASPTEEAALVDHNTSQMDDSTATAETAIAPTGDSSASPRRVKEAHSDVQDVRWAGSFQEHIYEDRPIAETSFAGTTGDGYNTDSAVATVDGYMTDSATVGGTTVDGYGTDAATVGANTADGYATDAATVAANTVDGYATDAATAAATDGYATDASVVAVTHEGYITDSSTGGHRPSASRFGGGTAGISTSAASRGRRRGLRRQIRNEQQRKMQSILHGRRHTFSDADSHILFYPGEEAFPFAPWNSTATNISCAARARSFSGDSSEFTQDTRLENCKNHLPAQARVGYYSDTSTSVHKEPQQLHGTNSSCIRQSPFHIFEKENANVNHSKTRKPSCGKVNKPASDTSKNNKEQATNLSAVRQTRKYSHAFETHQHASPQKSTQEESHTKSTFIKETDSHYIKPQNANHAGSQLIPCVKASSSTPTNKETPLQECTVARSSLITQNDVHEVEANAVHEAEAQKADRAMGQRRLSDKDMHESQAEQLPNSTAVSKMRQMFECGSSQKMTESHSTRVKKRQGSSIIDSSPQMMKRCDNETSDKKANSQISAPSSSSALSEPRFFTIESDTSIFQSSYVLSSPQRSGALPSLLGNNSSVQNKPSKGGSLVQQAEKLNGKESIKTLESNASNSNSFQTLKTALTLHKDSTAAQQCASHKPSSKTIDQSDTTGCEAAQTSGEEKCDPESIDKGESRVQNYPQETLCMNKESMSFACKESVTSKTEHQAQKFSKVSDLKLNAADEVNLGAKERGQEDKLFKVQPQEVECRFRKDVNVQVTTHHSNVFTDASRSAHACWSDKKDADHCSKEVELTSSCESAIAIKNYNTADKHKEEIAVAATEETNLMDVHNAHQQVPEKNEGIKEDLKAPSKRRVSISVAEVWPHDETDQRSDAQRWLSATTKAMSCSEGTVFYDTLSSIGAKNDSSDRKDTCSQGHLASGETETDQGYHTPQECEDKEIPESCTVVSQCEELSSLESKREAPEAFAVGIPGEKKTAPQSEMKAVDVDNGTKGGKIADSIETMTHEQVLDNFFGPFDLDGSESYQGNANDSYNGLEPSKTHPLVEDGHCEASASQEQPEVCTVDIEGEEKLLHASDMESLLDGKSDEIPDLEETMMREQLLDDFFGPFDLDGVDSGKGNASNSNQDPEPSEPDPLLEGMQGCPVDPDVSDWDLLVDELLADTIDAGARDSDMIDWDHVVDELLDDVVSADAQEKLQGPDWDLIMDSLLNDMVKIEVQEKVEPDWEAVMDSLLADMIDAEPPGNTIFARAATFSGVASTGSRGQEASSASRSIMSPPPRRMMAEALQVLCNEIECLAQEQVSALDESTYSVPGEDTASLPQLVGSFEEGSREGVITQDLGMNSERLDSFKERKPSEAEHTSSEIVKELSGLSGQGNMEVCKSGSQADTKLGDEAKALTIALHVTEPGPAIGPFHRETDATRESPVAGTAKIEQPKTKAFESAGVPPTGIPATSVSTNGIHVLRGEEVGPGQSLSHPAEERVNCCVGSNGQVELYSEAGANLECKAQTEVNLNPPLKPVDDLVNMPKADNYVLTTPEKGPAVLTVDLVEDARQLGSKETLAPAVCENKYGEECGGKDFNFPLNQLASTPSLSMSSCEQPGMDQIMVKGLANDSIELVKREDFKESPQGTSQVEQPRQPDQSTLISEFSGEAPSSDAPPPRCSDWSEISATDRQSDGVNLKAAEDSELQMGTAGGTACHKCEQVHEMRSETAPLVAEKPSMRISEEFSAANENSMDPGVSLSQHNISKPLGSRKGNDTECIEGVPAPEVSTITQIPQFSEDYKEPLELLDDQLNDSGAGKKELAGEESLQHEFLSSSSATEVLLAMEQQVMRSIESLKAKHSKEAAQSVLPTGLVAKKISHQETLKEERTISSNPTQATATSRMKGTACKDSPRNGLTTNQDKICDSTNIPTNGSTEDEAKEELLMKQLVDVQSRHDFVELSMSSNTGKGPVPEASESFENAQEHLNDWSTEHVKENLSVGPSTLAPVLSNTDNETFAATVLRKQSSDSLNLPHNEGECRDEFNTTSEGGEFKDKQNHDPLPCQSSKMHVPAKICAGRGSEWLQHPIDSLSFSASCEDPEEEIGPNHTPEATAGDVGSMKECFDGGDSSSHDEACALEKEEEPEMESDLHNEDSEGSQEEGRLAPPQSDANSHLQPDTLCKNDLSGNFEGIAEQGAVKGRQKSPTQSFQDDKAVTTQQTLTATCPEEIYGEDESENWFASRSGEEVSLEPRCSSSFQPESASHPPQVLRSEEDSEGLESADGFGNNSAEERNDERCAHSTHSLQSLQKNTLCRPEKYTKSIEQGHEIVDLCPHQMSLLGTSVGSSQEDRSPCGDNSIKEEEEPENHRLSLYQSCSALNLAAEVGTDYEAEEAFQVSTEQGKDHGLYPPPLFQSCSMLNLPEQVSDKPEDDDLVVREAEADHGTHRLSLYQSCTMLLDLPEVIDEGNGFNDRLEGTDQRVHGQECNGSQMDHLCEDSDPQGETQDVKEPEDKVLDQQCTPQQSNDKACNDKANDQMQEEGIGRLSLYQSCTNLNVAEGMDSEVESEEHWEDTVEQAESDAESMSQSCALQNSPEDTAFADAIEGGRSLQTNRNSLYQSCATLKIPDETDSEDKSREVYDKQDAEHRSHRLSLYQSCTMLDLAENEEEDESEGAGSENKATKEQFEFTDGQVGSHDDDPAPLNEPTTLLNGAEDTGLKVEPRELTDCTGKEELDHWARCLSLYKSCAMLSYQGETGCETKLIEQNNVSLNPENGCNNENHCEHENKVDELSEAAGEQLDHETPEKSLSPSTPDIPGRRCNKEVDNGEHGDHVASHPPLIQPCEQVNISAIGCMDESETQPNVSSSLQGVELTDEKLEVTVQPSLALEESFSTSPTKTTLKDGEVSNLIVARLTTKNEASNDTLENVRMEISQGSEGGGCHSNNCRDSPGLGTKDEGGTKIASPNYPPTDDMAYTVEDALKEDGPKKERQSERSDEEEFSSALPKDRQFSISSSSSNFFDTNADAFHFKSRCLDEGSALHEGNKEQGLRPPHCDLRNKSDCTGISSNTRMQRGSTFFRSQNTEHPQGIIFEADQDDMVSALTTGDCSLPSFTSRYKPLPELKYTVIESMTSTRDSTSGKKIVMEEGAAEKKELASANAPSSIPKAHDIMKDLLDFKARNADHSMSEQKSALSSEHWHPQADKLSHFSSVSSEQSVSQGSVDHEPTRFEQELVRLRKRLSSRRQKSTAAIDCLETDDGTTSWEPDPHKKVHSDDGVSRGRERVRELLKEALQSKKHRLSLNSTSTLPVETSSGTRKLDASSAGGADLPENDLQEGGSVDSGVKEQDSAPSTSRMVDQWETKLKSNPNIEKKRTRKSLAVGRAETLLKENSAKANPSKRSCEDNKSELSQTSQATEYKSLLEHPILQMEALKTKKQLVSKEAMTNATQSNASATPETQLKSQPVSPPGETASKINAGPPPDAHSTSQIVFPSNETPSTKKADKESNLLRETSSRRARLNDKLDFFDSVLGTTSMGPSVSQAKNQYSSEQASGIDSPKCHVQSSDGTFTEDTSFSEGKNLGCSQMSPAESVSLFQKTNPCFDRNVPGAVPNSSSPCTVDVSVVQQDAKMISASRWVETSDAPAAIEMLHDKPSSVRHRLASKSDDIWAQIAKKANLLGQIGGVSFKTNTFRSVKSKVRKYEKCLLDPEYCSTVTSSSSSKTPPSFAGFPMSRPQSGKNAKCGSLPNIDASNACVDPTNVVSQGATPDQTSLFRDRRKSLRENVTLSPQKFSRQSQLPSEIQSVADRIQELEGEDFDGTFSLCSTIKTDDSYIHSVSVMKTLKATSRDKPEDSSTRIVPVHENEIVTQSREACDQGMLSASPAEGDIKFPSDVMQGGHSKPSKKSMFSSFLIRNEEGSMMVSTDQEESAEGEQQLLEALLVSREDEASSNVAGLPKMKATNTKGFPVVETVSSEDDEDEANTAGKDATNQLKAPPNDASVITLLPANQDGASEDPGAASEFTDCAEEIPNARSNETKLDPDGIKIYTPQETIDYLNNSILDDSFDDDNSRENTINNSQRPSGTPLMSPLLGSPAMTPLLTSPDLTPLLNSPIMSPLLGTPTRGNKKSVPIEATLTVFRDLVTETLTSDLVTETLTSWNLTTIFNEEPGHPTAPKKVDTSNPELFSVECTLESHGGPTWQDEEPIDENSSTMPAICRNKQDLSAIDEGQEGEPEIETPSFFGGESLPMERPMVVSLPSWDETEIAHEQSKAGEDKSKCNNTVTDPATTEQHGNTVFPNATTIMPPPSRNAPISGKDCYLQMRPDPPSPTQLDFAPSKLCPPSGDARIGLAPPLPSIELKPKKTKKTNYHRKRRKHPKDVSDFPSYFPQRSDSFDVPGSDFRFVNDERAAGMTPMTANVDEEDSFPELLGFNAQKQRISSFSLVGSSSGKKRSKSASR